MSRQSASGRARPWARSRLARLVLKSATKLGLTVSRDDVVWCYRELLRREPESEDAILAHSRFFSFKALVQCFVNSPEYRGHQAVASSARQHTDGIDQAISAQAFRRSIDGYLREQQVSAKSREYIEMHFERLLDTINAVHRMLPHGGRILDYSSVGFFRHALNELVPGVTQTNVSGVNYELDDYIDRYGAGRYDLCICTEVLEHLLFDPSRMFFAINRMLKAGGHVLLSTPNAISMANCIKIMNGNPPSLWNQLNITSKHYYDRHNRDWSPFEVSLILQEHGFDIIDTVTKNYYASSKKVLMNNPKKCELVSQNSTHDYFGDTLFVSARKQREAESPVHNGWLYVLPGQF